jgi:hypothetical protein
LLESMMNLMTDLGNIDTASFWYIFFLEKQPF